MSWNYSQRRCRWREEEEAAFQNHEAGQWHLLPREAVWSPWAKLILPYCDWVFQRNLFSWLKADKSELAVDGAIWSSRSKTISLYNKNNNSKTTFRQPREKARHCSGDSDVLRGWSGWSHSTPTLIWDPGGYGAVMTLFPFPSWGHPLGWSPLSSRTD